MSEPTCEGFDEPDIDELEKPAWREVSRSQLLFPPCASAYVRLFGPSKRLGDSRFIFKDQSIEKAYTFKKL